MWSRDVSPFAGTHYRLAEPINSPPALATPAPTDLVGGGGEKKTGRLVARYADACNLFAGDPTKLRRNRDVLRAHCPAEGRPYEAIKKTTSGMTVSRDGPRFSVPLAQAVERLHQLAGLGMDHHLVGVPPGDPAVLDLVATEMVLVTAKPAVTGRQRPTDGTEDGPMAGTASGVPPRLPCRRSGAKIRARRRRDGAQVRRRRGCRRA